MLVLYVISISKFKTGSQGPVGGTSVTYFRWEQLRVKTEAATTFPTFLPALSSLFFKNSLFNPWHLFTETSVSARTSTHRRWRGPAKFPESRYLRPSAAGGRARPASLFPRTEPPDLTHQSSQRERVLAEPPIRCQSPQRTVAPTLFGGRDFKNGPAALPEGPWSTSKPTVLGDEALLPARRNLILLRTFSGLDEN